MKNVVYSLFIMVSLFAILSCNDDEQISVETDATYMVTFNFNWNAVDYPIDYPSNAHFSRLVGWSHHQSNTFFEISSMASAGIKAMAERGRITPLDNEINAKISGGEGLELVIGPNLGDGVGIVSANINVNNNHPAVTMVTMLAPSPDWYVGIINQNLYEGGNFKETLTVNAQIFDAGTDSGISYASANSTTSPQEPIALLTAAPLGDGTNSPTLATVTFTKQ